MKILNTTEQLLSKKVFEQNKEQHPWGRGELERKSKPKLSSQNRKVSLKSERLKCR